MAVPGNQQLKKLNGIYQEAAGNGYTNVVDLNDVPAAGIPLSETTALVALVVDSGYNQTDPIGNTIAPYGMNELSDYEKVVCSYMNETYNMSPVMNKIWLAHSRKMKSPEIYQKGYHALFIPLIKYAKSSKRFSNIVRVCIEDLAVNRTRDIIAQYKNTSRWNRGRVYRFIFEPICYAVGKWITYRER